MKAKYENPKDARDIAIELLQSDRSTATLEAMKRDSAVLDSALTPQRTSNQDAEDARIVDLIAKNINEMRGVK